MVAICFFLSLSFNYKDVIDVWLKQLAKVLLFVYNFTHAPLLADLPHPFSSYLPIYFNWSRYFQYYLIDFAQ